MDGYVATQAWAQKYPKTGAAFVRAIQEGQAIADTSPLAVQAAIAKYDLPIKVTAVMAIPGFPTGSVEPQNIERVAVSYPRLVLTTQKRLPSGSASTTNRAPSG